MIKELTSATNPRFKTWVSLLTAKGIRSEGLALVSGEKLTHEFLSLFPGRARALLLPPKGDHDRLLADAPTEIDRYRLTSPMFKELDVVGTHSPLLVVETPEIAPWQSAPPKGLELVVALGDPANLGALLRSAEAFGASRVILTQESSSPFLPRATKGASLSNFRVPLLRAGPLAELKIDGAFALDMEGESLAGFAWPEHLRLLLGEEGRGVPDLDLRRLKIPMAPGVESLNATVAASIALFSYRASRTITSPDR